MNKKEKIELKINKNVIKKVEISEDGYLSLIFKSPHPILKKKKENEF